MKIYYREIRGKWQFKIGSQPKRFGAPFDAMGCIVTDIAKELEMRPAKNYYRPWGSDRVFMDIDECHVEIPILGKFKAQVIAVKEVLEKLREECDTTKYKEFKI